MLRVDLSTCDYTCMYIYHLVTLRSLFLILDHHKCAINVYKIRNFKPGIRSKELGTMKPELKPGTICQELTYGMCKNDKNFSVKLILFKEKSTKCVYSKMLVENIYVPASWCNVIYLYKINYF